MNRKGTTFIELLLYIGIFLVLTPVLMTVSINALRAKQFHNVERQVNTDSQFMLERIYDLISSAKRIDVDNSVFEDPEGKLTMIMQDDSVVVIQADPDTDMIKITEDGITSEISSGSTRVESVYFERVADNVNDPDIVLGVTLRLNISGVDEHDVLQDYIMTSHLEKGDFDEDGSPDFLDRYPKHPECTGDADDDGICDEMDNCVFAYNPFQEDFDEDEVGDECDSSVFLPGGDGDGEGEEGGGSAFNCSNDSQILAILDQHPPLSSVALKQILISSSPLSPAVLDELIQRHEDQNLMGHPHFRDVFVANVKLPEDIFDNIMDMDNLPSLHKTIISIADFLAEYIPWLGVNSALEINYQVTISPDGSSVTFHDSDHPLGEESIDKTDIFVMTVENGSEEIAVTISAGGQDQTFDLNGAGSSFQDVLGFSTEIDKIVGDSYVIKVSNVENEDELSSVTFDFGEGAIVTDPVNEYDTRRYTYYCEGGCADDCGDGGTGIITGNIFTDRCYRPGNIYPEWCSKWNTFLEDDSDHPAYIGGTEEGEEEVYWEKTFKSILTSPQLQNLQSITVTGEFAYQSTTQFFCDQLGSDCPMSGELFGPQDIELYNWDSEEWEVIGESALVGSYSDQQSFQVKYDLPDVAKFIDSSADKTIKARALFHWIGDPPPGSDRAPCFMLIDYFTVHLKW